MVCQFKQRINPYENNISLLEYKGQQFIILFYYFTSCMSSLKCFLINKAHPEDILRMGIFHPHSTFMIPFPWLPQPLPPHIRPLFSENLYLTYCCLVCLSPTSTPTNKNISSSKRVIFISFAQWCNSTPLILVSNILIYFCSSILEKN